MNKRANHVMLRLTAGEHARLVSANADAEDLAVFARRTLLAALDSANTPDLVRKAAAFTVAALSPDIEFDHALALFDQLTPEPNIPTQE